MTNKQGSGTGPGPVQVNGGVLGGTGRITGAVTVGGDLEGTLAPGVMKVGRLLFKGPLTFNVGGQYACELDLQRRTADRVTANGVTIDSAAGLSLTGLGVAMLPLGTVFPIINNTSADPISGTFSGVEEGAIVTVGSNNLRVSYVGGDGNDLTLTVVP